MARYHINPSTGDPGLCRANVSCPFGSVDEHYDSPEQAREAYEALNSMFKDMPDHGPYPTYPVWNSEISQALNDAIEHERLRQHTNEARRHYLLDGWREAKALAKAGEDLTESSLMHIAGLVEPDNRGQLRKTPVTFAKGGAASSSDTVPAGVAQLVRFWPGTDALLQDKQYWLREFLLVHPLSDGNGRTAWVLQQWMMNSWDKPQKLWDFEF